jgi:hypothetical protein
MIKTFRGQLADGGQDKIRLSTKKGKIGYRIVKFQIIDKLPGTLNTENVVKIYKIPQTTVDGVIDFSDGNLLGTGVYKPQYASDTPNIIFDQETFNQDIYVTHKDISGNSSLINYYIELEVMSLSDNAAAVSTLRDIRLNPQVGA